MPPNIGREYHKQSKGKRIAIMGYSHHSDEEDHEALTAQCVKKVEGGERVGFGFFHQISSYFEAANDKFWSGVAFLNFLPRKVEGGEARFASGSASDVEEGRNRALAFLEEHKPDFLFVFSRKAWESLPKTLEDERGTGGGARLLPDSDFDRHHYRLRDGHVVQAFGLRHPQGARKSVMSEAVAAAMKMKPNPPA